GVRTRTPARRDQSALAADPRADGQARSESRLRGVLRFRPAQRVGYLLALRARLRRASDRRRCAGRRNADPRLTFFQPAVVALRGRPQAGSYMKTRRRPIDPRTLPNVNRSS